MKQGWMKQLWLIAIFVQISSLGLAADVRETLTAGKPGDAIVVQTNKKDVITGDFVSFSNEQLVLQNSSVGQVVIPFEAISKVEVASPNLEIKTDFIINEKRVWTGKVEAGLKGSKGNTENFSLRAAGEVKRTTDANRSTLGAVYNLDYKQNEDTKAQEKSGNRLQVDARSEFFFKALPRLSLFIAGSVYYDEFRDFDLQATGHGGIGYDIVKRDTLLLNVHAGAGVSKKFGAEDPKEGELVPEANFGGLFEWAPFTLQKLSASTDIFPNLSEGGEYRAVSKAAWVFYITNAKNLNLSLGVEHRYDSLHSVDTKAYDLDYFASIGWVF